MPEQAGHNMALMGDRDEAAEALVASELRYRRLFETAQDGILILDAETGLIEDVNPFLIEMLGFPHEAFVEKKTMGNRMLQGHRRQPGQLHGIAAATGTSATRTCRWKPPMGGRSTSSLSATSIW